MADDSVSAIDNKSNEINGESNSDEKQSNWGAFASALILDFFHIIIFILIGSNFLFFTYYDSLDLIFPYDKNAYISNKLSLAGGRRKKQKGGGSSYYCPKGDDGKRLKMPSIEILKSLGYDGSLNGWPYSMYDFSVDEDNISWGGFKNWFAMTECESFMWYRWFAQGMFLGGKGKLMQKLPQWVVYYWALFCFIVSFLIIPGQLVITTWKSFVSYENAWFYSLIGIFLLGYTGIMGIVNGCYQYLSILWNMLVVPLIIDINVVKQICACNMGWISLLFGALIVISGMRHLNGTTSTMMAVTWAILVIKHLFF